MCWSCGPTRREHGSSHRESRRHHRSLIPHHLPPVPLLSASPQGFCAPPRNVIFPPAASCRLPIFAEAIIAHRSSDCPFEPPPRPPRSVIPRHTSVVPPFFIPPPFPRSTSPWPGLVTETKKREEEKKERSSRHPPFASSFTSLALCLASIFALTKRNRLCMPARVAATLSV